MNVKRKVLVYKDGMVAGTYSSPATASRSTGMTYGTLVDEIRRCSEDPEYVTEDGFRIAYADEPEKETKKSSKKGSKKAAKATAASNGKKAGKDMMPEAEMEPQGNYFDELKKVYSNMDEFEEDMGMDMMENEDSAVESLCNSKNRDIALNSAKSYIRTLEKYVEALESIHKLELEMLETESEYESALRSLKE